MSVIGRKINDRYKIKFLTYGLCRITFPHSDDIKGNILTHKMKELEPIHFTYPIYITASLTPFIKQPISMQMLMMWTAQYL